MQMHDAHLGHHTPAIVQRPPKQGRGSAHVNSSAVRARSSLWKRSHRSDVHLPTVTLVLPYPVRVRGRSAFALRLGRPADRAAAHGMRIAPVVGVPDISFPEVARHPCPALFAFHNRVAHTTDTPPQTLGPTFFPPSVSFFFKTTAGGGRSAGATHQPRPPVVWALHGASCRAQTTRG